MLLISSEPGSGGGFDALSVSHLFAYLKKFNVHSTLLKLFSLFSSIPFINCKCSCRGRLDKELSPNKRNKKKNRDKELSVDSGVATDPLVRTLFRFFDHSLFNNFYHG